MKYMAAVVLSWSLMLTSSNHPTPTLHPQRSPGQPPARQHCLDEMERMYSPGALRKVDTQVQKCDAGTWTIDPSNGPKNPALEKQKACIGGKDQMYAAGALRPAAVGFERCDNGKWVRNQSANWPG